MKYCLRCGNLPERISEHGFRCLTCDAEYLVNIYHMSCGVPVTDIRMTQLPKKERTNENVMET